MSPVVRGFSGRASPECYEKFTARTCTLRRPWASCRWGTVKPGFGLGSSSMCGMFKRLMKANASATRLLAMAAVATALPMAAHASVVETFQWVPDFEQSGNYSTEPSATLQLTLSSFTLTPLSGNGLGPYYASGSDQATADITGFTYTTGGGVNVTVNLSNVSTVTFTTTKPWQTSGLVTPAAANGDQFPAPTQGYYLISQFQLSGTVNGEAFMMATATGGTAGTTVATGMPNSDFTYDGTTEEGGYWKLVTPVPLPPALPLLLSGVAALGLIARRRQVSLA
jgi:hypothetical protein